MIKKQKWQENLYRFSLDCKNKEKKYLYVCSDIHIDNIHCNRKLFKEHLEKAMELDAMIAIHGDFFCLMQGKYDPRSSKSSIMPEHIGGNYIEKVIDDAVEFMMPYAKNIILISKGNHETSVSNRMEFDITKFFLEKLNRLAGSDIYMGEYGGYYVLNFHYNESSKKSVNVAYHHGNWGGVVSKGTQGANRYGLIYPNADLFFSGHTHDGWILPIPRLVLNSSKFKVELKNQWHVKTGTYKEEYLDQKGWAVEKIVMPKFIGGALIEFTYNQKEDIKYDIKLLS
jgi:hypothetical protein